MLRRPRSPPLSFAILVLFVALTTGGGCVSQDHPSAAAPAAATDAKATTTHASPTAGTDEVTLVDNVFQPREVEILGGRPIHFTNVGISLHNVLIQGGGGSTVLDRDLLPGSDASYTLGEHGTYTLFCKYHRSQGMTGTIVVI